MPFVPFLVFFGSIFSIGSIMVTMEHIRVRFDFVRDAPDIATYMHALRAELLMKMVMPTVVGNGPSDPFLCMARWEAGPGGNMHWHGMAYGLRGPDMDGVVLESPAAAVGEGDAGPGTETVAVDVY